MLLYLCFATRKNYALIGSIISSIHTQNGFEHQQCIVQGVKLCHFRKCKCLDNQINAPVSNLTSYRYWMSYDNGYKNIVYSKIHQAKWDYKYDFVFWTLAIAKTQNGNYLIFYVVVISYNLLNIIFDDTIRRARFWCINSFSFLFGKNTKCIYLRCTQ